MQQIDRDPRPEDCGPGYIIRNYPEGYDGCPTYNTVQHEF